MKRDIIYLLVAVAAIFSLRLYHSPITDRSPDTMAAAILIWPQLMRTVIHTDYAQSTYSADFPPAVKAMAGRKVVVSGYMVPLDITGKSSHFILSRRTPTCPFCPPGAPNEVIEVETQNPLAWTEEKIVVSGTFELINNAQAGLFFKLDDARKL